MDTINKSKQYVLNFITSKKGEHASSMHKGRKSSVLTSPAKALVKHWTTSNTSTEFGGGGVGATPVFDDNLGDIDDGLETERCWPLLYEEVSTPYVASF